MNAPQRPVFAHLLRVAACLLMLGAGAAAQSGVGGIRLLPGSFGIRVPALAENASVLAVLLLAAVMPLFAKSRRWRTVQLVLDVAVLGLWTGSFLSTARLLGWAGAGMPGGVMEWTIALVMLSLALLYPIFGRPSHYCLWVCPYGAAQELASRLPVRKWRLSPSLVRRLTAFRRALWAGLMLALWCAAWSGWTGWELFGAFAWRAVPSLVTAFALAFVALSAFVPRAYCRFVCPTGTLFKLAESNQPGAPEP